ncbi:hypothetical protein VTK73DRAFT_81 [Phialemonium thermophilum]|uniref:Uncharacterized protein n=1 Tax=Phialemonium thermophilum TaxID=223376 RepID=A0ABR3Y7X7_9PEZI
MKELLDSDRVNYLVWRFLLESNYRETAAKFQKEWHIQAPHRHFDFAPHVKNYALISILNKGLVYESLERQFLQSREASQNATAAPDALQSGVFGPLVIQPPHKEEEDEEEEDDFPAGLETTRKRLIDRPLQLPNGSPAKRQRLSAGFENGPDSGTMPMDIDRHTENGQAYPSPLEGEQVASPVSRTEGPQQGTQVDKVHELSQQTIFLRLNSVESALETLPAPSDQNPIVLHCEWNPQDSSILAAGGTDALARVWTVSRTNPSTDNVTSHVEPVQQPFEDLMEEDVPRNATVTSMAWNSEGSVIAVATEVGNKARVSIWTRDGTHIHRFDGVDAPLIKLHWSPDNNIILGISPDKGGTLVSLFSSVMANSISYPIADHDLADDPLDATWINNNEFILCGGDLLVSLRITEEGKIIQNKQFDTRKDEKFSQVQFDRLSGLLATSSDHGSIDLWDATGQRKSINAHIGVISALQWQPSRVSRPEEERLLASSGEDGAIFLWNARNPDNKPRYSMTMENPVVALSFTPDGAFIAGATTDRILIWKVGDHQIPRASWSRAPHPGWLSPRAHSEQDEEDTHCLCWDASGQKLAYGVNCRLAVINFR